MANSDYGAIPLTLAESTSEALNTKLGVTTGFKPSEWPTAIASIPTGSVVPQFTETKIADNSVKSDTFTFTEDYHNYNLLRFKIANDDDSQIDYIYTTPGVIDQTFVVSAEVHDPPVFLLNYQASENYVTYTKSADNLTWSRNNHRQMNCTEVIGLTTSNCTMTVTSLYSGSRSASISIQDSIFDYDMLMVGNSRSTAYDEYGPASDPIYLPDYILPQSKLCYYGTGYALNMLYNITDHTIELQSGGCYHVDGIKFS